MHRELPASAERARVAASANGGPAATGDGPAERSTREREGVGMTGRFVVLEGGDGSGKSTQRRSPGASGCAGTGVEVVETREPGGTALGVELRQLLLHGVPIDDRAEALLMAADRGAACGRGDSPALARGTGW